MILTNVNLDLQASAECFDWEFYDAVDMISEMRNTQRIMESVYEAEKKCKEREAAGDDAGESDLADINGSRTTRMISRKIEDKRNAS